jgi:hypothetical protein
MQDYFKNACIALFLLNTHVATEKSKQYVTTQQRRISANTETLVFGYQLETTFTNSDSAVIVIVSVSRVAQSV